MRQLHLLIRNEIQDIFLGEEVRHKVYLVRCYLYKNNSVYVNARARAHTHLSVQGLCPETCSERWLPLERRAAGLHCSALPSYLTKQNW